MKQLRFFQLSEFDFQETGENRMEPEFLEKLDALRLACNFAFVVTSGFRHPTNHPIEAAKAVPGTHAQGIAADIAVNGGAQRRKVVHSAIILGFKGIGVAKSFVHVDNRKGTPVMWSY